MTGLLSSRVRSEVQPDDVAGVRNILTRHYQTSLPTAEPKSTASCRFSRVIPLISTLMSYALCRTGSMMIRPDSSRMSTGSSSSSGIASITAAGMRTAALFPHFFTTLFTAYATSFPLICQMALACQQCRYSGTITVERFFGRNFGYCFGYSLFEKAQKTLKRPAKGLNASHYFCLQIQAVAKSFETDRKNRLGFFESAAYANFATPAAFNFNSLPKPSPKPIGDVAYLSPMSTGFFESSSTSAR